MTTRMWVLQGAPVERGKGVLAETTLTSTSGPNTGGEGKAHQRSGTRAFRAVPLVRLIGAPGRRTILVGQARVWLPPDGPVQVEAAVQSVWTESESGWVPASASAVTGDVLRSALQSPRHPVPAAQATLDERQQVVAVVAKAVAEGSRNAAAQLRGLRYELEQRLAAVVRPDSTAADPTVLADLVELSVAVNRSRDQAREAAREGMWCWFGDDEAYQRHRRTLDPTLLNGVLPADQGTRRWMTTHDAGVRQCLTAERLLGEEAEVLARLLAGASTVVVAQDAQAQQRFNSVVTLAGLGLGLPALLLTLYGADSLVPIENRRQAYAFVPVALLAAVIALFAGLRLARPQGQLWHRKPWAAVLAVLAVLVLLLFAALVAPQTPGA